MIRWWIERISRAKSTTKLVINNLFVIISFHSHLRTIADLGTVYISTNHHIKSAPNYFFQWCTAIIKCSCCCSTGLNVIYSNNYQSKYLCFTNNTLIIYSCVACIITMKIATRIWILSVFISFKPTRVVYVLAIWLNNSTSHCSHHNSFYFV